MRDGTRRAPYVVLTGDANETLEPLRTRALNRRTLLTALGGAGAAAGLAACTGSASSRPAPTSGSATPAEAGLTSAGVTKAVAALPSIIERYRKKTGIPGLAVAVVYRGKVRYLAGSGVRKVGTSERVDPDTVFYLASVSKPLGSTVIAAALTAKLTEADWDTTIASQVNGFTLSDPWVGRHVTVGDMYSHRSGLPDHAGNLLEDLGYSREQTLAKLALYPLGRFRDSYEYTNYGLTAGGQAVANGARLGWNDLAQRTIFGPLGMTSSSYAYSNITSRTNVVALHRKVDGRFVAGPNADYEAQAPAGSASSSARDLAAWVTMLLAGGVHGRQKLIGTDELVRLWTPASVVHPPAGVTERAGFYGYGWNIAYDPTGEVRLTHSGAFARGSSTSVAIVPGADLGIVVLTNAPPVGVPEALTLEVLDVIRYGKSSRDQLKAIAPVIAAKLTATTADQKRYSKRPTGTVRPPRSLASYTGTYLNALYGPMTVASRGGELVFTVGPNREQHVLRHYSGDQFFFETTGEDATGFSGAVFDGGSSLAASVTINAWNTFDLGRFDRR